MLSSDADAMIWVVREHGPLANCGTYEKLRIETGAGPNLDTVRKAGISRLRNHADVMAALDRIAAAGVDPLGPYRNSTAIVGLDMAQVFAYARGKQFAVEGAIESLYRARLEKEGTH